MAYSYTNTKGTTYYLHVNKRTVKDGRIIPMYFFARDIREEKEVEELPDGYEVVETETGMLVLKKTQ